MGRNQKEGQKVKRGEKFAGSENFHRGCKIFATLAKLARLLLELFAYALFLH